MADNEYDNEFAMEWDKMEFFRLVNKSISRNDEIQMQIRAALEHTFGDEHYGMD